VVALTVDDGASDAAVRAILAVLEQERVNATWFPIGANVMASPSVWRSVAQAGFPIANHTWSHANLTTWSYAEILADLRHDSAAVSAVIGHPLLAVMRPPGGAWNSTVLVAAAAAGERAVVLWDTSLGDSGHGSVEQLVANGTRGTNGSIVLMHANDMRTPQALTAVIAYYRGCGYTFVTLGQMLGLGGPVPYPTSQNPPSATPTPTSSAPPSGTPTSAPTPTPMATSTPTPVPTPMPTPSEPIPTSSGAATGSGAFAGRGR
jgi:peptidoglycan-N-acetylglucosamine deacetylase